MKSLAELREKFPEFDLTSEQLESYKRVVEHQGSEPTEVWIDSYRALMLEFPHIVIGIERDGYAHS